MSQRELLQLLHTPLADTLLVAERLNVARINIAVAQTARQDLERQPSKLVDLCVALLLICEVTHLGDQREQRCLGAAPAESEYELERRSGRLRLSPTRRNTACESDAVTVADLILAATLGHSRPTTPSDLPRMI